MWLIPFVTAGGRLRIGQPDFKENFAIWEGMKFYTNFGAFFGLRWNHQSPHKSNMSNLQILFTTLVFDYLLIYFPKSA